MRVSTYAESLDIASRDTYERFLDADDLVRSYFTALADQKIILGSFPFGSTQFNDYDAYSDYDIVVAIEDCSPDNETSIFRAIHDAAKDIYRQTSVPLEVTCLTRTQITEGAHGLPDNMLSWLKGQHSQQPQNVLGVDFVPHIRPRIERESPSAFDQADRYVIATRQLLKKMWFQGVYYRPHDILGVVLSLPHVAGRKVLDALQLNNIVPRGSMADVRKDTITQSVESTLHADPKLIDIYTDISKDANLYRDIFAAQIPTLGQEEYDQVITATLDDDLPKGIELLRRMQEEYRRLGRKVGIGLGSVTNSYVEGGMNVTEGEREAELITALQIAQLDSC